MEKDNEWWGEWICFGCGSSNKATEKECWKCHKSRKKFGMRTADFSDDSDADSGAACNG